jgi:3-hydroxyacyl-CoA dehydrogenase
MGCGFEDCDVIRQLRLCAMGRFGRKAGAGWYRHDADRRMSLHDPDVDALVERRRRDAGLAVSGRS